MKPQPACQAILQALQAAIVPGRAEASARYFRTGPGDYSEGDIFWGITVPAQRQIVRRFAGQTGLDDWTWLTAQPIHEVRLTGFLLVVQAYKAAPKAQKPAVAQWLLDHMDGLNNWDLVDSTVAYVLAPHFLDHGGDNILDTWAKADNLWLNRCAIITTAGYIRHGHFQRTFDLADQLKNHPHDLIHKAVGWMLREVGNRDRAAEEAWLASRYKTLPRTLLRYAIEKFPESRRQDYLKGLI